jgi:hypothetical protein
VALGPRPAGQPDMTPGGWNPGETMGLAMVTHPEKLA